MLFRSDGEALVVVEPTSADAFRFDGSSFAPYLSSTALATGAPCGEAPTWLLRPSAINPRAEICTAPVYNFAILARPSIESRRRARDSAGPKIKEDEVRERVTVCGAPGAKGRASSAESASKTRKWLDGFSCELRPGRVTRRVQRCSSSRPARLIAATHQPR